MKDMVERAIEVAVRAHAGQVDKAGAPYILHPLRVMLTLETDEERTVAVLHDVLEDCPDYPLARLRVAGFPEEVIGALVALTKADGEKYGDFIERVALNPLATRVKIADLHDNMNLSRLPNPTEHDINRVRSRYAPALARLSTATTSARTPASPTPTAS
jgi:(p)ppGpp synthase/HD superfamily hydrolase